MSKQKSEKTPNELLQKYINVYLGDRPDPQDELEIRFGTKYYNTISRIDFDNIIEKMKSYGFTYSGSREGKYTLNIQNEYTDPKTGKIRTSNIRTTINGLHDIQQYCKENSLNKEKLPYGIEFLQKFPKKLAKNSRVTLKPIDFHDFHFRVNYKEERKLHKNKFEIERLLQNWKDNKKIFRFIKRFSFIHDDYPFRVDCSIIKTSNVRTLNKKKNYIPEYSVQESNVFNNPENYEIEIELLNNKARSQWKDEQQLINVIKKGIKLILSGWQQTNFPISFKEKKNILNEYINLIYEGKDIPERINSGDFIGPSSISLEIQNITPPQIDSTIPNINKPYTVTDKADGMRKLLYISKIGKIYLIDTNMNVQFTGSVTKHRNCMNTIIDGEHVLHDKESKFINLFLCFDIYFKNKQNMKGFPFYKSEESDDINKNTFRLVELKKFLDSLDSQCVIRDFESPINIKFKTFYTNIDTNIFSECKKILDGEHDGTMFEYETDGLIFTPCDKSVGSDKVGEITNPRKITWIYSLKWKPAKFNTIDFLVITKKTESGEDFVGNIFENGDDLSVNKQLNQYKTLILHVGFNEKYDGFINPCEDIIKDNIPKFNPDGRCPYKAIPFYPYDPSPLYPIYLCNIMLKQFGSSKQLFTEDNKQVFEDNTIVEFRFEKNGEKYWQWIPIRVRYDKTADYQRRRRISCNAYKTAESVWRSIHHPVTNTMITTGNNIPDVVDNDIYYNRIKKTTITQGLRDFHNRYIKRKLILGVSKIHDTLIDMTVGKAGDLQKWISAKLSFVFGLDISKDNIENRIDGACARYLKARKKYRNMPRCLFIQGNLERNIKNGDACYSEKGKQIVNALNGEGPKDESLLGKGVYKQYGKGKNGYNIVSNQFSIHYLFGNIDIFQNFITNISENCKNGGYFIGTCYDGEKIFKELSKKTEGESIFILDDDDTKIWGIEKAYSYDTFPSDESSLGYKIKVYQESINKTFEEYLVNFTYLTRTLENYGFVPIDDETAQSMGFPSAIGSFEDLFDIMKEEVENKKIKSINVGNALNMNVFEKRISFLNNYFIYKKVRNVDAKKIALSLTSQTEEQQLSEKKQTASLIDSTSVKPKRKVKKYKKKLTLP